MGDLGENLQKGLSGIRKQSETTVMSVFGDFVYSTELCAIKALLENKALPLKLKDVLSLDLGSDVTFILLLK